MAVFQSLTMHKSRRQPQPGNAEGVREFSIREAGRRNAKTGEILPERLRLPGKAFGVLDLLQCLPSASTIRLYAEAAFFAAMLWTK